MPSFMKMPGVVSELRSGHEKLMDGRIDRRTDGGHDIIRRVFDGRIKKEIKKTKKKQKNTAGICPTIYSPVSPVLP